MQVKKIQYNPMVFLLYTSYRSETMYFSNICIFGLSATAMKNAFALFSIFLLILSSTPFQELKIENQSHFAVDLNDPCINPNDIVFEYRFSIRVNPSLLLGEQWKGWENISFPDCEQPILSYVENDYHNLHIALDFVGYLSLSDVFQILDINLSESQFLDTQLDNDCFANINLTTDYEICNLLWVQFSNPSVEGQSLYWDVDELVLTPNLVVSLTLTEDYVHTSVEKVKSFPSSYCYVGSDESLFVRLAKNISSVPVSCNGIDFSFYNFSSMDVDAKQYIIEHNTSLSDLGFMEVSGVLNIDSYSNYIIFAEIQKNQPNRCDNFQDNDWSHDIRLFRIPVNTYLTNPVMTLENFASLLDICVSEGGDSPAIKLSSDETMAYIYNGGGSSNHDPIAWNINTNETFTLPITNYYLYAKTFTWLHGTHDLVGVDNYGEQSLRIINSTNSAPITHLLNDEQLSSLWPQGSSSTMSLYKFRIGTHGFLGKSSVIVFANDCHKSSVSQHNLTKLSDGTYTINTARGLVTQNSEGCNDYPVLDPSNLQSSNSDVRLMDKSYSFQILEDELIMSGRFKQLPRCNIFYFDQDNDGIPNIFDDDDDNDGIFDWDDYNSGDGDNDGIRSDCDFDDDGDGIADNLDSDNWFGGYGDYDNDGITGSRDKCPNGVMNWWTNIDTLDLLFSNVHYDSDMDGCHDILEDDDDDNDGVNDTDDDCPLEEGFLDFDGDGMCELRDTDDDNDGWSDEDEERCNSEESWGHLMDVDEYNDGIWDHLYIHIMNSSSTPADQDNDTICDRYDEDKDNDGIYDDWFDWREDRLPVGYQFDAFPLDINEWNDTDSDGIGDNSDDCVGTFGTSYIDRLGCLDQDSDGYSDLNDKYPYDPDRYQDGGAGSLSRIDWVTISIVLFLSIVSLFVIRKLRNISFGNDDEDEDDDEDYDYNEFYSSETNNSDTIENNDWPSNSIEGTFDEDGYEWCEHPTGSNNWFWRDDEGHWNSYDN